MGVQKITREQHLHQWAEQIQECRESRKSVSAWCEESGIKESTYYRRQRMVVSSENAGTSTKWRPGDQATVQYARLCRVQPPNKQF